MIVPGEFSCLVLLANETAGSSSTLSAGILGRISTGEKTSTCIEQGFWVDCLLTLCRENLPIALNCCRERWTC